MTLSPRSQMDAQIISSANFNPGDLKHATVVQKKSQKGLSPKEMRDRGKTSAKIGEQKKLNVIVESGELRDSD